MKHGVVTVLSVDGGGVRGLIPALVIQDLMRRIRFLQGERRRRHPVLARLRPLRSPDASELFDLFAGTSTGALMALGFARRRAYTPQELVDIYRRHATTIFPITHFAALRAVRQAFAEKYDAAPFEALLHTLFGDERLSECVSNVLIASYDTDNRGPFFFKRYTPEAVRHNRALRRKELKLGDFLLRDVARATSAAPTYFLPAKVRSIGGRTYSFLDGGLVANNPALSAYVEARTIYPDARRYVIVSLGTGRNGRRFEHETIAKWGYLEWVSPAHGVPLLSFISDGQSEAVAHSLKSMHRVDYFRFNADITTVAEDMDDARPGNMQAVEVMARALIREHRHELHRLARILLRRRTGARRLARNRRRTKDPRANGQ
jgi:patatin-like phospholipase/acyl hydrolase